MDDLHLNGHTPVLYYDDEGNQHPFIAAYHSNDMTESNLERHWNA